MAIQRALQHRKRTILYQQLNTVKFSYLGLGSRRVAAHDCLNGRFLVRHLEYNCQSPTWRFLRSVCFLVWLSLLV
jgi:hypothetical protein